MYQNEFMQLIAPFKDKVFRLAKRLLTSTEEAEDATQEIMVKLWCRNERLSGYANVEALAMTMTKNHCLDQLKSKRSFNSRILPANYKDREPSLQQKAEDNDSLSWVAKIIEQLPEQQRMIIQLREIEHYEF
ncbi:MAG: RNA polymerase sigma factor, partial [Flavobacterium sp.]